MLAGSRIVRPSAALRALAVLGLGAIAVHQLRYLFGYGSGAGAALAQQGHGYLTGIVPVLLALGLATLLTSFLARPGRTPEPSGSHALGRVLAYSGVLIATYTVQELSEGVLASGHPGGLVGLFGHGGLVVFPLALIFGLLAWLAARGLEEVEAHFARRRSSRHSKRAPARLGVRRDLDGPRPQFDAIASGLWARPPPVLAT
jgi:hypothetical protein